MLANQRAFTSSRLACKGLASRVSTGPLRIYCRESRIGSKPVVIPKGVTVTLDGVHLKVKGPKGELERTFTDGVKIAQVDGKIVVSKAAETRFCNAQHGLTRSLTFNMVTGVSTGFEKKLELVGTGYRAAVAGKELTLNVGYSKPRILIIPDGVSVKVEKNTSLTISGADKVAIGDFCATIRRQRPPEPYKGKGIRYAGEVIKLKEGKGAGKKK